MTYKDGKVEVNKTDEWLNSILESGSDYWGDKITEQENTAIHEFYRPLSYALLILESSLKNLIEGTRIEKAEGVELDYIGRRVGIDRYQPRKATGKVEFSRSSGATRDYLIPEGTVVETSGDPVRFGTTEAVTLNKGSQSVTANIEALEAGSKGNVGAGTITEAGTSLPAGIQTVTNPDITSGGRSEETDEAYRERIKTSIGDVESASGYELYQSLGTKEFVYEMRFIDNSEDKNGNHLNAHQFEVVVDAEPGHSKEIAQTIFEHMPMGADVVAGNFGTATSGTASLSNGQTFTIPYSKPATVSLNLTATISTKSDVDVDKLKRKVINYIGGTLSSGNYEPGDLRVGDDVVYGEVEYALRDVPDVYDIDSLKIGPNSPPSNTSNISIGPGELASLDASNISITKQ